MKERTRKQTARGKGLIYDRLASRYDRVIAPLERRFLARMRAETLARLPPDSSILEIGAGTGLNFPFYPRAALGAASELSCEMLKIAAGKSKPERVHLVQTSAERLPFADASFDAAFATLVFCSIASPEEAFHELRRVVRSGGTIVLLEHVRPKGLMGYFFDALSVLTVALFDDHFNRRTDQQASRAGLQLISVEPHMLGIFNLIVCRN
ncbi:MAG TPA: methyltransferase domain-containing protein [Pyrinomonadaceae bacterium]|nr:methyltransferase domain-containing protein [Pyrinomonadaceae bacterium]